MWNYQIVKGKPLFDVGSSTKIVFLNERGFTHDHRGSDHTPIELDWRPITVLRENNIEHLIDALFRIKSHMFVNWYELLSDVERVEFNEKEGAWLIHVSFDHGS